MARSPRSAERFKYGVCLNDECPECKKKTVQKIPLRKELVCSNPECGKPLREVPPPPPPRNWALIGGIVAGVLAVGGIGGYFATRGGDKVVADTLTVDSTAVAELDTIPVAEPVDSPQVEKPEVDNTTEKTTEKVKPQPQPTPPTPKPQPQPEGPTNGTVRLSYGTYTGDIKGGYPNGRGSIRYNTTRQISRFDSKGRVANAGDEVTGTFKNGFLVMGKHFDSSGNLIESLNLGSPVDGIYEDK